MPNAVLPVNFNTPFGYVTLCDPLCDPITEAEAGAPLIGAFSPPTKSQSRYCRGADTCGGVRLNERRDGPFWRLGYRCLKCRLKAQFARFGLKYEAK